MLFLHSEKNQNVDNLFQGRVNTLCKLHITNMTGLKNTQNRWFYYLKPYYKISFIKCAVKKLIIYSVLIKNVYFLSAKYIISFNKEGM